MRSAARTSLTSIERRRGCGRWRLRFDVGGMEHAVNLVYHDPPDLPDDVWRVCLEEVGLACLVDVAAASMTCIASTPGFDPGPTGVRLLEAVSAALRLEVAYDWGHPLALARFEYVPGTVAPIRVRVQRPDANRVLLLMGGGKDSLYALQLLSGTGYDVVCFYLTEARRTWQQLRKVAGMLGDRYRQHRAFLDVNRRGPLLEEFGRWYLSQYQIGQAVSMALPYALAERCRAIVLGIERGTGEPMARYRGRDVNHQHQKSPEYVDMLNVHLAARFGGGVRVASPLGGLYDTGIYARFLRDASELVPYQSSCGGANGRRPHCGRCAKCAFLAAVFAGVGGSRDLYENLFPTDPLASPELYDAWLSAGEERPMTCAGFKDEVRLALSLAQRRGWALDWYPGAGSDVDRLLRRYLKSYQHRLAPRSMRARLAPLLRMSVNEVAVAR